MGKGVSTYRPVEVRQSILLLLQGHISEYAQSTDVVEEDAGTTGQVRKGSQGNDGDGDADSPDKNNKKERQHMKEQANKIALKVKNIVNHYWCPNDLCKEWV